MVDERLTGFERDGLHFEVTDDGPLDGTPVLLLHGFPTDRTSWRQVARLLAAAGLRTVAPDQRGYSPGARPRGVAPYRLEHLVADVVALADAVEAATGHHRVHVVGHDWGGAVAWLLAAHHADRVASLTVLSTPHPAALSRALRDGWDQRRRSWYMAAVQVPWLPEQLLARRLTSVLTDTGLPLDDARRYAAHLGRPSDLTGPLGWYRATRSSTLGAHRVTVPTTYVWGSRDFALGRRAATLTAEHVTGPYDFVEVDAGHWLPETRAEESAAAVVARVASAG